MKKRSTLFLFAGDQKIEHLNSIAPEHLFSIANKAKIDAFATHLGLIARYGPDYKNISYVAKLNGKTNLVPTAQKDPLSLIFNTVDEVVQIKDELTLSIIGVGYTVYLGSEFESHMLSQAAQIVFEAHRHNLLSILWMYPRGKAVSDERDADLIAGAAGVGASLGADFVKVNVPEIQGKQKPELLQNVVTSAGKTGVICAGGQKREIKQVLLDVYHQIHQGNTAGVAIGRNIFEHEEKQAIRICNAISAIVSNGKTVDEAIKFLSEKTDV